ncbi:MAG: c-type cytochrome domain-containing protein [Opitutales bacterium]
MGLIISSLASASATSAETDFVKQVWPIIQESCLKCHGASYVNERGRTKEAKSGLRLDSPERIMKGSENTDKIIVPKKPEESLFYKRIILPEDDIDVMPSKGPLLTQEQIEIIKKWITEGAKFGDWKGLPENYEHKK